MFDINRRTFMQATAATALASAIHGSALASPKRGRHTRVGLAGGSSQDNLDPASVEYDSAYLAMATARSTLLNGQANGHVAPSAGEMGAIADVTQWTFEIRQGVTYHSGKTLRVDDVIASFNLHRGRTRRRRRSL